jgi:hypothetical protein
MKEIVKYAVVTPKGDCVAILDGEDEVRASGYYLDTVTIVKLTGTLPEPKRMKKVASYVYRYDAGGVFHANQLLTEAAAKQECEKYNVELIKWPHGDVLEVEEK